AAAQHGRAQQPHHWFAQRLLLVLSGQRPVHTLLGHVQGPVFEELARLAPRAPLRPRGVGSGAPVVAEVDRQQPRAGVIEAFARITSGGRLRALAFRLEADEEGDGDGPRWRCAALALDGLDGAPSRSPGGTGPGPHAGPARTSRTAPPPPRRRPLPAPAHA
ncbi:Rv3235 family protein, partial [Streptomyces daliensis]